MSQDEVPERFGNPWILVTVLSLFYIFAFVDRTIISLLIDPIKADLKLTDIQVSIVMGVAFSFAYAVMNLPAGFVIDRFGRRGIVALAAVGWSFATIFAGMAGSFLQLLAARVALGFSESFITPASFSLIRDRVHRQGWGFSLLAMSPYCGAAVALIGGAAILHAAQHGAFNGLPLLNGLAHWQKVFAIAGLASLPLVPLLFLIRRDDRDVPVLEEHSAKGIGDAIHYIRRHWRLYLVLIGYGSVGSMQSFGIGVWTASMMHRRYDLDLVKVGFVFGAISLVFGLLGLFFSGFMISYLKKRRRGLLGLAVGVLSITTVASALMPLMPKAELAWVFCALANVAGGQFYPIGASILAEVAPGPMMGRVSAVYLMFQSLIGTALGPTLVALIAQYCFAGPSAIAFAISIYAVMTGVIMALMIIGLGNVLRDRAFAQIGK